MIRISTGYNLMGAVACCSAIRRVGQLYKHNSPYTYFSSKELHLGEISLECSRPGAAAVALWATQRLLPLEKAGNLRKGLERCREAAREFHRRVVGTIRALWAAFPPELDIVIFAPRARSVSAASAVTRQIFDALREAEFASGCG